MKRSETSDLGFDTRAAGSPRIPSAANRLTSIDGIDRSAMQDWLRIHRRLVELEAEFSEVVMRAAAGESSVDKLQEKRNQLIGMRDLCTAAYEKAFGGERRL
jgi:hypothetical protein